MDRESVIRLHEGLAEAMEMIQGLACVVEAIPAVYELPPGVQGVSAVIAETLSALEAKIDGMLGTAAMLLSRREEATA